MKSNSCVSVCSYQWADDGTSEKELSSRLETWCSSYGDWTKTVSRYGYELVSVLPLDVWKAMRESAVEKIKEAERALRVVDEWEPSEENTDG